jgi:hypothetical protein
LPVPPPRKPIIQGTLGYFGLGDWWIETFSAEERRHIEHRFRPFSVGGASERPLTEGEIFSTSETLVGLLTGLMEWFPKPDEHSIADRIYDRALREPTASPVDRHFLYSARIGVLRGRGEPTTDIRELAEMMVAIAPAVRQGMRKEGVVFAGESFPAHVGYNELVAFLAKDGDFDRAIELAELARRQRWNGDWTKELKNLRYQKKIAATKTGAPIDLIS